ncbi:unnamed protein product [Clavelina lepadiformis]|uniref:Uncharacterized protein n=1 Tax=Clavelina lepadiformis TaxID=159417 RepID=A0ABP0G7G0_CLALP
MRIDLDEGVVNSYVYILRKFYAALDETCKTILQGNQYVMSSCPDQCPTAYGVSDSAVYTVGKTILLTVDAPLSSPISNSDITLLMLSKTE